MSEQAASGSDQRGAEGSSLDLCPALFSGVIAWQTDPVKVQAGNHSWFLGKSSHESGCCISEQA